MELLEKISEFADYHDMFPRPGLILAAVSGGADSVCLLASLSELSGAMGFSVAAVHYNHKLRGVESDRDEDFVRRLCRERGVPFYVSSGDVRRFASERRLGIEEAARRLRYGCFREIAEKIHADRIATAHTADDNAETVLLNITRGAGLKGLGGIPPKRGMIIRPMLTVTRHEVLEFLSSRSQPFAEDSTNSLDIYRRNLLRHRVVPVLTEINPRFLESVAVSSSLLREDEAYLTGLARDYIAAYGGDGVLDISSLAGLPRPVAGRAVRLMAGASLSARNVADVLSLCRSGSPSGQLSLPGITIRREYDRLVFSSGAEADAYAGAGAFAPVPLPVGGSAEIPELGLRVTCKKVRCGDPSGAYNVSPGEKINKTFNTFLFKYDSVCGKIVIRPRETGDKIALFGGSGTKSLKKLFIEKRIPLRERPRVPVVADEAGILAVLGIANGANGAIDRRAACRPGDTALEIDFKENTHEK